MRAVASDEVFEGFGYPRPQLRRKQWLSLDGQWQFACDASAAMKLPREVKWEQTIQIPYAPETVRSGIHATGFYSACWYRRELVTPPRSAEQRLILHFGAVDYEARVWIDGQLVKEHEGGYTPFSVDITDVCDEGTTHELVVRAFDDPADLAKPRGKQDWELEPHSIWYPRTTGIWQTVWLEVVPETRIESLRWSANLERWELFFDARVTAGTRSDLRIAVKLRVGDTLIADDTYRVIAGEVHRRIAFSDPGIDDSRNRLLWSPERPTLIEAEIDLWGLRGEHLDTVYSYTALRAVAIQGDQLVLNGRPMDLRFVLDQGYWPEGGMTANDEELKKDVLLAKAMGFNGVRKHQKLESPRYLYWADKLGLMVWAEMPSAYRFTPRSVERLTREWMDAMARDMSHPCIVAWVPFNESWGVPNLPDSGPERHYVQALYHLTRTFDPTRPVIGNDGWESVATDLIGIHDYDADVGRIGKRYHAEDVRLRLFNHERPGGRVLTLDPQLKEQQHPIVLSEFGGIALVENDTWGYSRVGSPDELEQRYTDLLQTVHKLDLLCGFCYTQFADTYQEANGLLYANREPKFPIQRIALATTGRDASNAQLGEIGDFHGGDDVREGAA
ncbi:MAG: glycoside hydrolase family 2 TIM barrel-domain containing protein [Polyangiales bacterium]